MIRYIDAGTTRQHLTDRLMESALNNVGIKADADEIFRDIAENRLPVWIDELPTYDVQEVRHGKWIYDNQYHWYRASCSMCGYMRMTDIKADKWNGWNYCPNCGARMIERSEEC